ncbi:MAG: GNAT family N-acetyltransferase [Longimicrobiales bacterium]|nr:GNAT family N-acetyltransferase [Longimicrobiales bacterium]
MGPERLSTAAADAVVEVLCDAFAGYPTFRYVLDGPAPRDDPSLRALVRFFVMARLWRGHPVLGVRADDRVVAAATVTPPDPGPSPEPLDRLREATWARLGEEARSRYEAFGRAAAAFRVDAPHHYLNMIGVAGAHRGKGLARPLLDAVHGLTADHPLSGGVMLTTEAPENLPLYDRFGYARVGHERVDSELETWGFFRPC